MNDDIPKAKLNFVYYFSFVRLCTTSYDLATLILAYTILSHTILQHGNDLNKFLEDHISAWDHTYEYVRIPIGALFHSNHDHEATCKQHCIIYDDSLIIVCLVLFL